MQRAREEEGATTHSAGNVYWPFLLYERTNGANECTSGPPVDTPQKPTHRVVVTRVALHNLTTPVMAIVAVAAVVVAAVGGGLGGLAPTAQNTRCVW